MPPGEWAFVLANHNGVAVGELNVTATLRFEENRPTTIKIPLHHDQRYAARVYEILDNGLPQVRAYRKDSLGGTLRASCLFAPLEDQFTDDESVANTEWKSPLASLEYRFHTTGGTFTSEDQGDIAWALIEFENNRFDTLIEKGTITATKNRDRTYEAGKQILEALIQLSEVQEGVNFWETPLEPTENDGKLAAFNAGPRPGSDRRNTVRFEVGDGTLDNCISASRTIGYPVNMVTAYNDADPPLVRTADDQPSWHKYGIWQKWLQFPGVTDETTLTEHAAGLLIPEPVTTVTFTPDPNEAPEPWVDWWLGDTVSFKADSDALQIATTARPRAIEIDVDEEGTEVAWRVEWGDQRPYTRRFREALKRMVG